MCAGFGVWGLPHRCHVSRCWDSISIWSFFVQAREDGTESCESGSGGGGWNNILPRPLDDGVFLL
jgi:hypothetical protein